MKLSRQLFNYAQRPYAKSQQLSKKIDKLIELNVIEIESKLVEHAQMNFPKGNLKSWGQSLHDGAQSWVGLSPEQLQTTYDELIEIVELLNPSEGETWLDLGAGYSRLAFVLNTYCSNIKFVGYEVVRERVDEANRLFNLYEMNSSRSICQDLSSCEFQLPCADTYFLYDYGKIEHIKYTLNQISEYANKHSFSLVARGRVRDFINYHHPWLSVKTPILKDTYNIYFN